MATVQRDDNDTRYLGIVDFFDQAVLASYTCEPDKYVLETDHFEGHLTTAPHAELGGEQDYVDIRFGYCTLANGDLALAVFLPDLYRKSVAHARRWAGYHLADPMWAAGSDERFELWKRRYLEGSWAVDNGPRSHLEDVVAIINALTVEVVGCALFRFPANPALNFPSTQNTHAYQDAHKELYGFVIDGLDKQAIERVAARQGLILNVNSDNTRKALEKALPAFPAASPLWPALEKVSAQRRETGHGVRTRARRYPAFEEFTRDLEALVAGLRHLLDHLERVLGMGGAIARRRQESKKWLPRIDRPPMGHFSIMQLPVIVGKTVERVEFGFRRHTDGVHESEAIILHFTDGSILGVDTGSNAVNVASDHHGLKPSEFHVDFVLYWVPPPDVERVDAGVITQENDARG